MLEKNKQTCHCFFFLNFPISKTRKQPNGNIYTGCPKWYDMNPYIIHNGSHNESFMVDKTNCYFNSLIGSASVFSTVQYKTGCLITQRNYFRGDFAQETMHTTTRAGKVNYLWPVPHFGLWSLPDHMTWQTCVWPESPWSLLPIQRLYNTEKGDLRNSTVLAECLLCSVKV